MEKIRCRIKERSWLAAIAARKMGVKQIAMVVGSTIHLHGSSRHIFMADTYWVRHEVCHIKQYREHGMIKFLWLYLTEYFRRGYYMNRFEVAARTAEADPYILDDIEIV
ncbi:DUF4157 domain-containing protein [Chitinophaga nivalis]|uniref:DUF4157 domain-containing protein n=1 Tax=Chitinophaga nivalis TaxID=2991709 RepID=A0ABT3IUQ1_9BACT|nr:DUF4157 domain-containing protein [Chitinophaga nivalis]MCW3462875.1 DUF4157 domain-containing protein [Chitinophaga nivalis]MCW3487435.1 DUF4157 domain-containing protein [Chitinophaga nivalis]